MRLFIKITTSACRKSGNPQQNDFKENLARLMAGCLEDEICFGSLQMLAIKLASLECDETDRESILLAHNKSYILSICTRVARMMETADQELSELHSHKFGDSVDTTPRARAISLYSSVPKSHRKSESSEETLNLIVPTVAATDEEVSQRKPPRSPAIKVPWYNGFDHHSLNIR